MATTRAERKLDGELGESRDILRHRRVYESVKGRPWREAEATLGSSPARITLPRVRFMEDENH